PAAAADVDRVRDTGRAVSPAQGGQQAAVLAQAGDRGAEGQLEVQLMAAARAGSPYLGRDYAFFAEGLHLQLTAPVQVECLSGPGLVRGVLIRHFRRRHTGGIVHFTSSSPAAYPP